MRSTVRTFWPARTAVALTGLLLTAVLALAQATTPSRILISSVEVHGNRQVQSEYIRNLLKSRPDTPYSPDVVQEDVRTLYATRQFGNVSVHREDDGPGRVKLFFTVRDYPNKIERIEYRGARALDKDALDAVTGIRRDMPLNPIANKVACQRIVQRYHEEGRPFASCTLLKGGEAGDREVVFEIAEGYKVRVESIDFTGHTFVSAAVLRQRINSSRALLGVVGGTYNPAMVESDINDLVRYYKGFGYHDVRVSRELRYSPDGRHVGIIFHIHEGLRYQVQHAPTVHGVRSLPAAQLEAMMKLSPGKPYDQRVVDGDRATIEDTLGRHGRKARVEAIPVYSKDAPGIVNVEYMVKEEPPARVGQIIIIGNDRTRQEVILKELEVRPGQILNFPGLRLSEAKLARRGIFETSPDGSVRPTLTIRDNPFDPSSPYKDVIVNVTEANTGSLLFGVGVNSDSGLTGSIVLHEKNFDIARLPTSLEDIWSGQAFRGGGQELRIEAVPGTQLQRYTVTFREPYLFDSLFSLTTSAYFYQRYFNEYHEERFGARVTVGRKLSDLWSVSGTVRIEDVGVSAVPFFAPADYTSVVGRNFQTGIRAGVTRDTRDSFLRPTEGSILDLSFEQVVGDRSFQLAGIDFNKYFTTYQRADGTGRHVLVFHSQVGWAGDDTPVYERFFAGGFRSLRGFQFRGVGPDVGGFKTGGNFMLLNSLEYQIPVLANDQVYAVGFVDSGTVASRIDSIDSYRVSAGFGVRFTVPMLGPVPIALDFGFPIVKGRFDLEQVFMFYMGFGR